MVQEQERGRSGKHYVEALKVAKILKMVTSFPMRDNINKMVVAVPGTMAIMLKNVHF